MTSIITGIFALMGGFLGGFLTRNTEYEKWLRQQRSIEFSEFIKKFERYKSNIREILSSADLNQKDKDLKVTEESIKLDAQKNIVKMYLPNESRAKFSDLTHNMWAYSDPRLPMETRMKMQNKFAQEIQELFEQTLMSNPKMHLTPKGARSLLKKIKGIVRL